MEDKEDIEEVFRIRIRKIDPQIADEVLSAIMSRQISQKIKLYLRGTDDNIRSLIEQTRISMKPKSEAHSPGRPHKPAHVRVKNQLQSSSTTGVGCSNTMTYLPSSPEPHIPSDYISNGLCLTYVSCPQQPSSGFWPLGNLENEIRQLLLLARPYPVLLEDLHTRYSWRYNKVLRVYGSHRKNQDGMMQWNGMIECNGMSYSLSSLHTVLAFPDRYGRIFMCLLEDVPRGQYQGDRNGSDHIYITFNTTRRLTERDVGSYFSQYGTVTYVRIPVVDGCRKFGFVRFLQHQTVDLLLSKWDPKVPHFIFGVKVFAKRYKPIAERIPNQGDNAIQVCHASKVPKEETVPENNSLLCSGENEQCPHLLCEIESMGARNICPGCRKLLREILELVRMREKC